MFGGVDLLDFVGEFDFEALDLNFACIIGQVFEQGRCWVQLRLWLLLQRLVCDL